MVGRRRAGVDALAAVRTGAGEVERHKRERVVVNISLPVALAPGNAATRWSIPPTQCAGRASQPYRFSSS